jgi:hypothetical protein
VILALFLAAATTSAPAPVLHFAETKSVAYRNCVAAEHKQRPSLTVAQIGRGRCAGARSKLFSAAHGYVRYGWRAVRMNTRQAQRLKAQHKINAEAEIVRFETALEAWLSPQHVAPNG